MSTDASLDRESFQQLLADAFAVQESQVDSQALSAIVEVQRLITRGELDVDGAMHLIADRARNVANATGVAIGLLKGEQLVYRAGSGSASTYIGRHVMASLTVSADTKRSREILRVENAQTDTRIEAAISLQFGAKALLILPIYHDRAVAGVAQILFSEAHTFQDREIRAYRLMAELIGEAMFHAAQLEQKKDLTSELLPNTPCAMEQITAQGEKLPGDGGCMPGPANKPAIDQPGGTDALAVSRELPVFDWPALPAIMQRAKGVPWHKRQWNFVLAAVITVLIIAYWSAYGDRRRVSPLGSSPLPRSIAIEQQVRFLPAQAVPAKGTSKVQTAPLPVKAARTARTRLQRVRVGDNEVDYIGDDVTVRYFTSNPAPQRVRVGKNEIAYIGDDVTVRYFTPTAAAGPPTRPIGSAVQPVAPSWSVPAKPVSSKPAK